MHLTDCFMELVAYVVYFKKTVSMKQPSYDQVRSDITRLFVQSDKCPRKGMFNQEDFDLARLAICAWVDETVLGSSWNDKTKWQGELLQRVYFNMADAGEVFFEKLNMLGPHQRDVREVYYICLSLGFTGRFCNKEDEYLLEQLRTSNLKLLSGSSVGTPSLDMTELFPDAQPQDTTETGPQKKRLSSSYQI